ncbi:MAG: proton-conducting membrane transporter [Ruminococcaceae bacterium]|nr:proton-conducting membrane transporter [Oscillospiraceae bacterium]
MSELILLLPILLPVTAGLLAGFLPCFRRDRALYPFMIAASFLTLFSAILAAVLPTETVTLLSPGSVMAITFRMDDTARFFSLIASAAWCITAVYSCRYMKHEDEHPRFYAFYLIVIGFLNALFTAANLFTMYLTFELMTLCSMPLVLHIRSKEAVYAGMKYLFYSMAGALFGLFGFIVLSTFGDPLMFRKGGVLDAAMIAGKEPLFLTAVFLMIVGFCTKGGMFPMHAWLPSAHPIAPAPASAQLSAVITKAGVLCVIRTVYFIASPALLTGTWVQTAWMCLALLTIFMGSMMAYREHGIKKRLAYSTISQVSYIFLGLSLMTPAAVLGALLHVVFHMAAKSTLFLATGSIIHNTGNTRVDDLRGIGLSMPVTMWCWTIAGLSLVGIPPTSAFLSKWYLAEGALAFGAGQTGLPAVLSWLATVILLVSALLTAGYLLTVSVRAFFPGRNFDRKPLHGLEDHRSMMIPTAVFAGLSLVLGLYAEPLIRFFSQMIL